MGPQITKTQPSFLPSVPDIKGKLTLVLCWAQVGNSELPGGRAHVNHQSTFQTPQWSLTPKPPRRGEPQVHGHLLLFAESWAGGPSTGKPVGNCPYSSELWSPGILSHLLLMLLVTPLETDCPMGSGLDVLRFRGKRIASWEKCCLGEGTKDAFPSTEDPAVKDPWSPCLHCWLSLPLPEVLSPEGNPESLIRKGMMNPAYNWKDAKGKVTEAGPYLSPVALWGL